MIIQMLTQRPDLLLQIEPCVTAVLAYSAATPTPIGQLTPVPCNPQ